jgi:hypothetical protein
MSNSSGLASSAARGMRRSKRSGDQLPKLCGSWATKTQKPQTPKTGSALPGFWSNEEDAHEAAGRAPVPSG